MTFFGVVCLYDGKFRFYTSDLFESFKKIKCISAAYSHEHQSAHRTFSRYHQSKAQPQYAVADNIADKNGTSGSHKCNFSHNFTLSV